MKRLFMVLVALGAITWFGASATTATAGGHGYRGYGPQYGHHGPQQDWIEAGGDLADQETQGFLPVI